ncbi:MAG TPA: methionyl-tRNA formyltransferase, partial [Verrucomicrobiae bacterium]|nr:methionyl-tRNA formyltransferase [Verrucomicrobiae bacterium]
KYLCESVFICGISMSALRIIFMGTPELAGKSLDALLRVPDFRVIAVATQPDQPKGRGLKLTFSPVKEIALRENLPLLQPQRAREENFIRQLRELAPDLIVVAAYGQILPQSILDLPRFGCLNVHTSLLPKWRGAAPIQRAILNGENETGVTIMKMDAGMDTGEIVAQEKTPIESADNSQTLHDRLAEIGAALLVKTIPDYVSGKIQPRPQPIEGVSYAAKIKKSDGQINWNQSAREIWNRIRAMIPWPGAFAHLSAETQPQLIKIWDAEPADANGAPGEILSADKSGIVIGCGENSIRVKTLQREGGRRLSAAEFLAGHPLKPGKKLV